MARASKWFSGMHCSNSTVNQLFLFVFWFEYGSDSNPHRVTYIERTNKCHFNVNMILCNLWNIRTLINSGIRWPDLNLSSVIYVCPVTSGKVSYVCISFLICYRVLIMVSSLQYFFSLNYVLISFTVCIFPVVRWLYHMIAVFSDF